MERIFEGRRRKKSIIRRIFGCVFPLGMLLAVGLYGYHYWITQRNEIYAHQYDTLIQESASRYGVDSLLIRAVIWKESNFKRNARGRDNDIGLMQIVRSCAVTDWAQYHKRPIPPENQLYDPRINIEIGTWYLSRQLRKYGKLTHGIAIALSAYNAGPGITAEWFHKKNGYADGHNPLQYIRYESTQKYIVDILKQYEYYQDHDNRSNVIRETIGDFK